MLILLMSMGVKCSKVGNAGLFGADNVLDDINRWEELKIISAKIPQY